MSEQPVPPNSETLIEFPCDFPFKIVGDANDRFIEEIVQAVKRIVPEFEAGSIDIKFSSRGKYVSVSCDVAVTSKEELDKLYRELHAIEGVRFLL